MKTGSFRKFWIWISSFWLLPLYIGSEEEENTFVLDRKCVSHRDDETLFYDQPYHLETTMPHYSQKILHINQT